MKLIKVILTVVCVLLILLAIFCLLSELGGKTPEVVYAVQTSVGPPV